MPTGNRGWTGDECARRDAGSLEVWVCTACSFTEWYSRGANEVLARMMQVPGTRVRYVDGDASTPR